MNGVNMGENGQTGTREPGVTFACRCEEVRNEEIAAAVLAGARSIDDVKRRTRAGMGACQGIFCMPTIAAIVAQATGTPMDRVAPMTARPPVRPILVESLTALDESGRETGWR